MIVTPRFALPSQRPLVLVIVTRNAYYNVMKNPKTAAERKSKYRERLKRHGLAEYRVVIPDNAECRKTMREKAEHLSKNYVRKHTT